MISFRQIWNKIMGDTALKSPVKNNKVEVIYSTTISLAALSAAGAGSSTSASGYADTGLSGGAYYIYGSLTFGGLGDGEYWIGAPVPYISNYSDRVGINTWISSEVVNDQLRVKADSINWSPTAQNAQTVVIYVIRLRSN